jgi:hypothetical protein
MLGSLENHYMMEENLIVNQQFLAGKEEVQGEG